MWQCSFCSFSSAWSFNVARHEEWKHQNEIRSILVYNFKSQISNQTSLYAKENSAMRITFECFIIYHCSLNASSRQQVLESIKKIYSSPHLPQFKYTQGSIYHCQNLLQSKSTKPQIYQCPSLIHQSQITIVPTNITYSYNPKVTIYLLRIYSESTRTHTVPQRRNF